MKETEDSEDLPGLGIGQQLRYHAVPLGKELEPFLTALSMEADHRPTIASSVKQSIHRLDTPAFLRLFITPHCPHCPVTVRQVLPLPAMSNYIHLAIIDGTLFPEAAKHYQVQSAPTLLLDRTFRWAGSVPLEELVTVMLDRDPMNLGPETLENMLKEGNASQVAEMMLQKGMIFPALLDLLAHEKMFVRLGAMVVVETIADKSPAVAAQVIDPLWERFEGAADQVQGDIAHVFGQSRNRSAIPLLESVLAGEFSEEVKEAARESLAFLRA
jgi:hypothetical protein